MACIRERGKSEFSKGSMRSDAFLLFQNQEQVQTIFGQTGRSE